VFRLLKRKKMDGISVKVTVAVPPELEDEIEKITWGKYRSRQEFILECIREKLDRLKKEEAKA